INAPARKKSRRISAKEVRKTGGRGDGWTGGEEENNSHRFSETTFAPSPCHPVTLSPHRPVPVMRQLLVFSIIILLAPLSFFAPFTGLVSYVVIAYVRPHEWAYMPEAQLSLAVAIATFLGYAIFEFARRAPRLIPNALLSLLWLQLTIATFLAHSQELAQ